MFHHIDTIRRRNQQPCSQRSPNSVTLSELSTTSERKLWFCQIWTMVVKRVREGRTIISSCTSAPVQDFAPALLCKANIVLRAQVPFFNFVMCFYFKWQHSRLKTLKHRKNILSRQYPAVEGFKTQIYLVILAQFCIRSSIMINPSLEFAFIYKMAQ